MRDSPSVRATKPFSLTELADLCGFALPAAGARDAFRGLALADRAGHDDVAVFADGCDAGELAAMRAPACLVAAGDAPHLPDRVVALVVENPWLAYAQAIAKFCRPEMVPGPLLETGGIDPTALVHADAHLEAGVVVEAGAVIGPRVEIGTGTTIGANSVVAADVSIGRFCAIDSQVSIRRALIGDRVVIYAGARIGLGGPPSLPGDPRWGALPKVGRVIVQDGVEIGANAAIERGAAGDTTIGEGARIASLAIVAADTTVPRFAQVPAGEMASRAKMV